MATAKTLLDILPGTLSYDQSWGIYAEKIEGVFKPESPARLGQRQFKNGGVLDEYAIDKMWSYLGRDEGREEATISQSDEREAAEWLINEINEEIAE